ncbi:hypothetical protein [Fulvimonas yonginensis]|uniref:Tetratricopeptide repeat protein n=1 Tax=Fulvimonas yonginensis TaxID=1495200 RepID=A0ABU8JA98_9GAMM
MTPIRRLHQGGWWWLLAWFVVTCFVYLPGLSGGFLFDDYPNIVDNRGVQPTEASVGSLVRAALSSPASDFKRPLASLSFAANFLATGLDPFWMKLTNVIIHLLNGLVAFLLVRALLRTQTCTRMYSGALAAWITGAWMVLPVNLTAVLYIVQRMESLANLFVLLGLLGYVTARQRMRISDGAPSDRRRSMEIRAVLLCSASLSLPMIAGLLAKETAVMLPLYAALVEWVVFGFRRTDSRTDWRIAGLFVLLLVVPMAIGLAWLLPGILRPETWAARDFTLASRLLSEARIVATYVDWIIAPLPDALSFYHDDFQVSTGLLHPWTTLASLAALLSLLGVGLWQRRRHPLFSLGVLLFLGCHLLTGTILPLELVYEHRNYFASLGVLLAIMPPLAALPSSMGGPTAQLLRLPRRALLLAMVFWWIALTAFTAKAWGDPLRLAEELAARAPQSPRAQYELGRTYIIYSRYDPSSPFTKLAYAPLERAAALPGSSILPQQALIFMNSRMHLSLKDAWWDSMISKLRARRPGVQDESSLGALTQCQVEHACDLPKSRMIAAYLAALSHPNPSARLLAMYGDYAWNVLGDRALGLRMLSEAVAADPAEPAYRITLVRMFLAEGDRAEAGLALHGLESLNIGGRLDGTIRELHARLDAM